MREQTMEMVQKHHYRKQLQNKDETFQKKSQRYANRIAKKHRTDKPKAALLARPAKNEAIIKDNSPRTRQILEDEGMIKTPSQEKEANVLKALASDYSGGLEKLKLSHSNENRAAFRAFKSLACGIMI